MKYLYSETEVNASIPSNIPVRKLIGGAYGKIQNSAYC